MKKLLSLLISLVLIINTISMSVAFAETKYVEVTEASAPIRNDCYDTGNVLYWVPRGTMLEVLDSTYNWYLRQWYKVSYDTGYSCCVGWIWSGNVIEHKHNYVKYNYNGNTFGVCEKCKTISVERVSTVKLNKADALAAAIPLAATAAAADGPIPVGDIAAVFILGLAYLELGREASYTQIREMVGAIAIDDYIRDSNVCNNYSFYKVQRVSGGLIKIDNICMNVFQAFICSRYCGIDVWTHSQEAAVLCVDMNSSGWFGPERDNNKPDYYYHFHYGWDHNHQDVGTHVFFGRTENGQEPGFY